MTHLDIETNLLSVGNSSLCESSPTCHQKDSSVHFTCCYDAPFRILRLSCSDSNCSGDMDQLFSCFKAFCQRKMIGTFREYGYCLDLFWDILVTRWQSIRRGYTQLLHTVARELVAVGDLALGLRCRDAAWRRHGLHAQRCLCLAFVPN